MNQRSVNLQLRDEAQTLVGIGNFLAQCLEIGVELWQVMPEIVECAFEILLRHEEMLPG